MKSLVIAIIVIMCLSPIYAVTSTYCDERTDVNGNPIQGVEIMGSCYDCSVSSDGVCPEDYGASCDYVYDADCDQKFFWSKDGISEVTEMNVVPGKSFVFMTLSGSNFQKGDTAVFKIYEDDSPLPDQLIKTKNKKLDDVLVGGGIMELWYISQDDIDKANEGESGNIDDFYFTVETFSQQSGELLLNVQSVEECEGIVTCSDYTEEECTDSDKCDVIDRDDEFTQYGSCTLRTRFFCGWDSENSVCESKEEETYDPTCGGGGGGGGFDWPKIGTCQKTDKTTDTCDDGWLDQKWDGVWTWGADNSYTTCPSGVATDCIDDGIKLRFDPQKKSTKCISGEQSIVCPGELELPFFSIFNLIAAIGLIGLIYFVFRRESL